MQYWPSTRWSFSSRRRDDDSWVELPLPFALIGSHERCQVHVEYKRLPPVVYFAVVCGSRVEVWPLCGIAFPIWGRIKSDTQLLVGKQRLSLMSDADPNWMPPMVLAERTADETEAIGQSSTEAEPADAVLVMDWGTGEQTRRLSRQVTILGEGHPSSMRMHGLGLRICELGIVCVGKRVWAVQLNPDSLPDGDPMVRELIPGGQSIWVGNVHLWANKLGSRADRRFGDPLAENPPSEATPTMPGAAAGDKDDAVPQESSRPIVVVDQPHRRPMSSITRSNPQHINTDRVASDFTDRLLEKTEKRANRQSLIKWSVTGGLLLAAISVAGFVLIRGVLPIFRAIYSE
ncbi:hypothetical protein [Planctomycetes bacterium TBK1r]|uniref:RING-type E3 ubiquitin transferase n=1 Tax=Stieleria magnilauensis TaxID=2527963 RepID=A0ABX5XSQ5_9BACT|nr:hypothetical protein TBK1r_18610 [Planctomycetes bacterium TBK1r]